MPSVILMQVKQLEEQIEESRKTILNALSGTRDITFLTGAGNIGDHLIWAGTRQLLSGIAYREASLLKLNGIRGHTALVCGGGAWCKSYHDMPHYLPMVEQNFERVVILPSSFDTSENSVQQSLLDTPAVVFAREETSYAQIRPLCHAELAVDCAFFFDYSPYRHSGSGCLNAFRVDKEAVRDIPLPADNLDISVACRDLDEWLWTIARYEKVRTDRAHVMIAAAMLGKDVEYRPSSYHKVESIAQFCLSNLRVQKILVQKIDDKTVPREKDILVRAALQTVQPDLMQTARNSLAALPASFIESCSEPEITAVILSYGRFDLTRAAVQSLREHVQIPYRLLIVDNGSDDQTKQSLRGLEENVIFLDKNLGCGGGRMVGAQHAETEYVLLLDNDAVVLPGAVEHLLAAIKDRPDATAVTGKIVFPDETIHTYGGAFHPDGDVLDFELLEMGRPFDHPVGSSRECDWVSGCFTLLRKDALISHPYDPELRGYYEDLEWCYRSRKLHGAVFLRCAEAIAIHRHESKFPRKDIEYTERHRIALPFLKDISHFQKVHGKILSSLFTFIPELGSPLLRLNVEAGTLFLHLLNISGPDWFLNAWNNRTLEPLFPSRVSSAWLAASEFSNQSLTDQNLELRQKLFQVEKTAADSEARNQNLQSHNLQQRQDILNVMEMVSAAEARNQALTAQTLEQHQKILNLVDMVAASEARNQGLVARVSNMFKKYLPAGSK